MEEFKDKIAVVTGGAQGIGRCIADEFQKAGAHVCVIDKQAGNHFVGDISDKQVLERFVQEVIGKYGHVDYLINNALPLMKGIDECSYEEFQYAMSVGVTAPFYLAKLPHEPTPDGKLYSRQGRHRITDACTRPQPCRTCPCQLYLPWLDRHCLYRL